MTSMLRIVGSNRSRWILVGCWSILALGWPSLASAEPPRWHPEMKDDAQLWDVCFIDTLRGWAVGDRGAIWRTVDGGQHWQLQDCSVGCSLRSIHFSDSQNGWIVGGWTHPYSHHTSGVVLRTTDGGQRWVAVHGLAIPALKHVEFLDSRRGWALGNSSAVYCGGILQTEDGGRSWSALPAADRMHWVAGDFTGLTGGVVAGYDGRIAVVSPKGAPTTSAAGPGGGRPRRISMQDPLHGWLVGDGGLVMRTVDGGLSWQRPPGPLPGGIERVMQFEDLAIVGDQLWIVGSPGSVVLHSPDRGRTWSLRRTGHTAPLCRVVFVDDSCGWTVGALGSILATRDGGHTWQHQRGWQARVAALGIFSEVEQVPMPWLAKWSAGDGYLAAVQVVCRRDVESPSPEDALLDQRLHEAVVQAGGSTGNIDWRFPLRQPGLEPKLMQTIGDWDLINGGDSTALLQERLVCLIRQWRPELVVTEPASPRGERPLSHLINQLVLAAAQQAADSTTHSTQLTLAGLEPWSVKKVFCVVGPDQPGSDAVSTVELLPGLGRSVADQAELGRRLIDDRFEAPPATLGLRSMINAVGRAGDRGDLFSGIVLAPGGGSRRRAALASQADLQTLHRLAQKRRNIQNLIAHDWQQGQSDPGWLGQVDDMISGLNAEVAGEVLFQLAGHYQQSAQVQLAADVHELMLQRFSDHPLTELSLLWLMRHYVSGENAHGQQPEHRTSRALMLGEQIQQSRPALFADPRIRFPLAVAHRRHDASTRSESYFHSLAASQPASAWGACAQAELWRTTDAKQPPPKATAFCRSAASKPFLDGQLNDPIWKETEPLELTSNLHDDSDWPAVIHLAYDAEYLFVAIQCRHAPGVEYSPADSVRPRDPDLGQHDRVDLLIDIDRDYTSFYQLTIDSRGWASDACVGDATWNPHWYIAAGQDSQYWTVEAAIAWDELQPSPPRRQDAWAVGVQRTVPQVGFQSWSRPAAVEPRAEGFGLLIFQ